MTFIINSSFSSSTVPEDWRTTLITPVFKNAIVQKSSDQFPSQVSSATSARSSHIVISCTMQYAEDNIIIAPEQHGFKCGHSCESQLLGLITKISELMHYFQEGKLVDLVGWTFCKACFTRCSITGSLLEQMHGHGSRASWEINKLSWLMVPGRSLFQGSVLGPELFVPYISDLPQQPTSRLRLFDTICQHPISTAENQAIFQNDLNNFCMGNEKADGTCASTQTDVTS